MKNLTFLFIFLFSLISLDTSAQDLRAVLKEIDEIGFQMDPMDSKIAGSPYLNEEWQEAEIETTDNQNVTMKARYRYYDGIMEIKKKYDEKTYTLGKKNTKSITIGEQQFIPLTYTTEKGVARADFLELLADGQLRLLIRYDKVITSASSNGYVDTPEEMKAKRKYFIYDQSQEKMIALSKLGKKSILPLFGKHSKNMESYAKKNKLSFKKTDGLSKIIGYYNDTYAEDSEK